MWEWVNKGNYSNGLVLNYINRTYGLNSWCPREEVWWRSWKRVLALSGYGNSSSVVSDLSKSRLSRVPLLWAKDNGLNAMQNVELPGVLWRTLACRWYALDMLGGEEVEERETQGHVFSCWCWKPVSIPSRVSEQRFQAIQLPPTAFGESCCKKLSCAWKSWSEQLLLVGKCWSWCLGRVCGRVAGSSFLVGKEMGQLPSA